MARRGASARAAALRRAQQAKAARDAVRLRREKDIEAALADYFEATERAERIRADARRKADRLLADAEQAADAPWQTARAAVHRLRALVGTATEVASLCGISVSEVRAALNRPVPGTHPGARADEPVGAERESDDLLTHEAAGSSAAPAIPPGGVPGQGPPQQAMDAGGGDERG
ncbi:MAG: hypothetical protein ABSF03_29400 [Streptosporangiaceae bacterium]